MARRLQLIIKKTFLYEHFNSIVILLPFTILSMYYDNESVVHKR